MWLSISLCAMAVSVHLKKMALLYMRADTLVWLNSAVAVPALLILTWWHEKNQFRNILFSILRSSTGYLLLISLAGTIGFWLGTLCIAIFGPITQSFLNSILLIHIVWLSRIFGERLRKGELYAIGVVLIGLLVFSYQGMMSGMSWMALGLMCGATLMSAFKLLSIKTVVTKYSLWGTMTIVLGFVGIWAFLPTAVSGNFEKISCYGILLGGAGAITASVIGMGGVYASARIWGAARTAPIMQCVPLLVLGIACLKGDSLPSMRQIGGGIGIIAGSVYLAYISARGKRYYIRDV